MKNCCNYHIKFSPNNVFSIHPSGSSCIYYLMISSTNNHLGEKETAFKSEIENTITFVIYFVSLNYLCLIVTSLQQEHTRFPIEVAAHQYLHQGA